MLSRRDVLQVAAATAALGPLDWTRAFAQQRLTQDELLRFDPVGNVTLVHIADIHAQLVPLLFREPSANLGVGDAKGHVPHITGQAFLDLYWLGLRATVKFTSIYGKPRIVMTYDFSPYRRLLPPALIDASTITDPPVPASPQPPP